jgi:HEAT repeat protein
VLAGFEGDEAAATALLDDGDPAVRAAALGALVRLGRATPEQFARALCDPAASVRRRAAELSIARPDADYHCLLNDRDASVVETACFVAGERHDLEVLPQLCRVATAHADSLCREAAVAALGALGDPAGLPTILASLSDRATVRRRAVIALAPFDGPEVQAALRRALGDRDWQVRQAAEDQLLPERGNED